MYANKCILENDTVSADKYVTEDDATDATTSLRVKRKIVRNSSARGRLKEALHAAPDQGGRHTAGTCANADRFSTKTRQMKVPLTLAQGSIVGIFRRLRSSRCHCYSMNMTNNKMKQNQTIYNSNHNSNNNTLQTFGSRTKNNHKPQSENDKRRLNREIRRGGRSCSWRRSNRTRDAWPTRSIDSRR